MADNCSALFSAIATATESLPNDLYATLRARSLWVNLVPREEFKRNTGLEQTTYTLGDVEPTDNPAQWSAETITDANTPAGACAINDYDLNWGFDTRVYSPEKIRLRGPVLCKDNFTYNYMPEKFLGGYVERLGQASQRTLEFRLQEHYISGSNKYIAGRDTEVVGVALPAGQQYATLPALQPTSQLTQDMLDQLSVSLNDKGAANQTDPTQYGFFDWGPDGPLYTLYIGQQASKSVTINDPSRVTVNNFADMGMGNEALLRKRIGSSKVYYNFRHVMNPIPPRYIWDGTKLVRVPVYIQIPGSGGGLVSILNPAWKTAPYEAAFVLNPLVMTDHMVQPDVNPAGIPFDPISYMGEWDFITGAYRLGLDCEDPQDKFGRHLATFKHAVELVHPEYGYTILFRRCIQSPLTVGCSY